MHNELKNYLWIFDVIFKVRHSGSTSAEVLENNSSVKDVFYFDDFLPEERKAGALQRGGWEG